MGRFDADGNYIEPKRGLQDGQIAFDANYGREGLVQVTSQPEECDGCGQPRTCLWVDQSEGEYYPALVCRECIDKLFSVPSQGKD